MNSADIATYILNADDAALDGWTLTALTAALRPALASLGVTVEAHPQESGLGGLQSDDADLRDQVRAIVERVVSSTPDELASRTAAARTLGSTRSPRKAASSRANGSRGGRPVVLGTISAGAGRATVAWHPGRQRIGVRSLSGWEWPEDGAAETIEQAVRIVAAWYAPASGAANVWEWEPVR